MPVPARARAPTCTHARTHAHHTRQASQPCCKGEPESGRRGARSRDSLKDSFKAELKGSRRADGCSVRTPAPADGSHTGDPRAAVVRSAGAAGGGASRRSREKEPVGDAGDEADAASSSDGHGRKRNADAAGLAGRARTLARARSHLHTRALALPADQVLLGVTVSCALTHRRRCLSA